MDGIHYQESETFSSKSKLLENYSLILLLMQKLCLFFLSAFLPEMYTHTCTLTHAHTCMRARTHTHTHTPNHIYIHIYTSLSIYISITISTHTHTQTHSCTHANTHTCTQAKTERQTGRHKLPSFPRPREQHKPHQLQNQTSGHM